MQRILGCTLFIIAFLMVPLSVAHDAATSPVAANTDRMITFPDTRRYKTLILDPHTHSSFSDGHVWPRIRVEEALRDGLDAIAITEHLEWQPHLQDIAHSDRNRAHQIAALAAEEKPVMVIAGSEITRSDEAGHINALFINDANKLLRPYIPEDPSDAVAYYTAMHGFPAQAAVDAAAGQDAFMFWNHPWWGDDFPDSIPVASDFHITNVKDGKIKGIEIANGDYYSEEAFQIALDLDLTLIGSSDIHELIDWDYLPHEGGHRPVTIVLAKKRTASSLRAGLVAGRTLVWFKNTLIAREPQMKEMLEASLSLTNARYESDNLLLTVQIENSSDVDFFVQNEGAFTFSHNTDSLSLPQHSTTTLVLKTAQRLKSLTLPLKVMNALIAPKQNAVLVLEGQVSR
jgi:hypothetical protein